MIRIALALLVLGAFAQAEVELPLGPYARLGVPVLVRARGDVEVSGWRFSISGTGLIHPPTLPATIEGEGSARLEPVPEGTLLVGVLGSYPTALEEQFGRPVRLVSLDPAGDWLEYPAALAVFDRLLTTPAVRLDERGLRSLAFHGGQVDLADWDEVADIDWSAPSVPQAGNVWPEIYDLVRAPEGPEQAAWAARWVVLGIVLAMGVQLLLAGLGWIERRNTLIGLALVALLGGVLGLWRPRAEFTPLAGGAIEIVYRDGIHARVRRFEIAVSTGPGAAVGRDPGATPCFYRSPGQPWWARPGDPVPVPEGQQRLFLTEKPTVVEPGRLEPDRPEADRSLQRLLRRVAPAGSGWEVAGWSRIRAPRPLKDAIPLLGRVEVAPVR